MRLKQYLNFCFNNPFSRLFYTAFYSVIFLFIITGCSEKNETNTNSKINSNNNNNINANFNDPQILNQNDNNQTSEENVPPLFDPLENQAVEVNQNLQFEVKAVDPDNDEVMLSALQLPDNSDFNVSSGLFN